MIMKSTHMNLKIMKLSHQELQGIHGGTLPSGDDNQFGYSVSRAPGGAISGTINYERNLGKGFSAGADLTRQGDRTFGGINVGGPMGSHGTWKAEATRFGNETNITIRGGFHF